MIAYSLTDVNFRIEIPQYSKLKVLIICFSNINWLKNNFLSLIISLEILLKLFSFSIYFSATAANLSQGQRQHQRHRQTKHQHQGHRRYQHRKPGKWINQNWSEMKSFLNIFESWQHLKLSLTILYFRIKIF